MERIEIENFCVGLFLGFFMTIITSTFVGWYREYITGKRGGQPNLSGMLSTWIGGGVGQCIFILLLA